VVVVVEVKLGLLLGTAEEAVVVVLIKMEPVG
jgi:hypothetical protein